MTRNKKIFKFIKKVLQDKSKGFEVSSILGLKQEYITSSGGFHTGTEISRQPEVWKKLWQSTKPVLSEIELFIRKALNRDNAHIILTGAGTSSFIGDVLEGPIQAATCTPTKSVATTDLVTHPELYFSLFKPVLLISFARSGDSPESSKAIELAEQLSEKVYHLVITCNKDGELIKEIQGKDSYIFHMPPESNDKSLAMTSSFTTMLLAGLIIANISNPSLIEKQLNIIIEYAELILNKNIDKLKQTSELNIQRAVFLGSGIFRGIAREAHLKLQELTDGKIVCKHDTFLGFRHGPKAVVDDTTLVFCIFSNNEYVNKYEIDLVNALKNGRKSLCSIGVMEKDLDVNLDMKIVLSEDGIKVKEEFLTVVSVLPAQILGFLKSLQLGLKPDSPSDSGMIHRVVQGVTVYPYTRNGSK